MWPTRRRRCRARRARSGARLPGRSTGCGSGWPRYQLSGVFDNVPDGWQIQNVDRYSLVIAPVGATDKDPNSYLGKIHLGNRPPTHAPATQGLLLPAGRDSYLIFQIPGQLRWDAATVADFAAGVHMTAGGDGHSR
ncbi:hypothetical protein [Frankia tisae]|uniref:hypothetical protein n=1 Tax=Frankia tisae TaxID=2950104 RepID=UPI0021C03F2F|nr:hypothetical protein [Frankia tisae]